MSAKAWEEPGPLAYLCLGSPRHQPGTQTAAAAGQEAPRTHQKHNLQRNHWGKERSSVHSSRARKQAEFGGLTSHLSSKTRSGRSSIKCRRGHEARRVDRQWRWSAGGEWSNWFFSIWALRYRSQACRRLSLHQWDGEWRGEESFTPRRQSHRLRSMGCVDTAPPAGVQFYLTLICWITKGNLLNYEGR